MIARTLTLLFLVLLGAAWGWSRGSLSGTLIGALLGALAWGIQDGISAARLLRWLKKEALPLLVMLGLLAAARDTLANHYQVPSGSMQHTLMPGDRVVVDMRAYGVRLPFTSVELLHTGQPQRGDVAVFDSPQDGTRLIKPLLVVSSTVLALRLIWQIWSG